MTMKRGVAFTLSTLHNPLSTAVTGVGRALLLLVVGLGLAGCLGRFQQPQVRLDGVRLGSIGMRGGLLYAQLSVSNPNGFGLEARSLTYDLQLADAEATDPEWVRLADGKFAEAIVVGARDSTRIEVPVEFSFANVSAIAQALLERGMVDYRVSGIVDIREPVSRSVPYRRAGKVNFGAFR
jgi:LEA14-like dessication related protein